MNKKELTKAEMLKLITPIVDNEANKKERAAFLGYISDHEDVRIKFIAMRRLKRLLQERCPRAEAPESLRIKVKSYIKDSRHSFQSGTDAPIYDIPNNGLSFSKSRDPLIRLFTTSTQSLQ